MARDRCFIAASREFEAAQVSLDSDYSVLTQILLQGLNPKRAVSVTNFGLVDYINQNLDKKETQRPIYSNFGEPITLIRALGVTEVEDVPAESDVCPYKGLRYFDIADADYFFGREDLLNQLLDRVREKNFVAILGASGSGKSSVLRAGLLYQLQQGQRLSGSRDWQIKVMVPTKNPLQRLAELFVDPNLSTLDKATELDKAKELLAKGSQGLVTLTQVIDAPKLVIVIDQFEETFTPYTDREERTQFLACLLGALSPTESKFKLILGMRIDFLGKCFEQDYSGLGKLIQENLITVSPLNREQLQRAITLPAKKVNLQLEEGLVEQILKDSGDQPGILPLVQDTLTELWKQQDNNDLKLSVYAKLGGISGTLNKRATAFYEQLLDSEKEAVKHIFIELTQLGEGTEDTRRRVFKQDLITEKYSVTVIEEILQKLANERLIVMDEQGENLDKKVVVEVAHEALIREWILLRQWLDEDRANLLQQQKIEIKAQEWEKSGKKSDLLLQGFSLKEARKFQKEQAVQFPLDPRATDFIAKSIKKQRQNFLKLGVIPLVGVSILTFFGIRTYIVQSNWRIVQKTQGDTKRNLEKIKALESLVWWKASLANNSFQKNDLSGANLSYADLSGANLSYADLTKATLTDTNLTNANLTKATLTDTNLINANLTGAYLTDVTFADSTTLHNANLTSAYLIRVNFNEAQLSRTNFSYAKLDGANFKGIKLYSANFTDARLNYAILAGTDLNSANLSSAGLNGANLSYADFTGANLNDANISYANFTGADNLDNTQIKSACFWEEAIYQAHYDEKRNEWITDEKANQAFIKKLKNDKASDPKEQPNCSQWKL